MKLSEIRELCEKATSGPWRSVSGTDVRVFYKDSNHRMALASTEGNAAFIAASRALMPKLLAVVEALKEDLKHYPALDAERAKLALAALESDP